MRKPEEGSVKAWGGGAGLEKSWRQTVTNRCPVLVGLHPEDGETGEGQESGAGRLPGMEACWGGGSCPH